MPDNYYRMTPYTPPRPGLFARWKSALWNLWVTVATVYTLISALWWFATH